MGETFTNNLIAVINNKTEVKDAEVQGNLDADELIFFHSLRADLELLTRRPKLQTIHNILNYSKSLR